MTRSRTLALLCVIAALGGCAPEVGPRGEQPDLRPGAAQATASLSGGASWTYRIGMFWEPWAWNTGEIWTVYDFYVVPPARSLFASRYPGGTVQPDLAMGPIPRPELVDGTYRSTVKLADTYWSDGTAVTAFDVEFTFRDYYGWDIAEALDDKTAVFHWGPQPPGLGDELLGAYAAPIVQKGYWSEVLAGGEPGDASQCGTEPSAGPFTWGDNPKVEGFCPPFPRNHVRNPYASLPASAPDQVSFSQVSDGYSAVDEMLAGTLDFYANPLGLSPGEAAYAKLQGLPLNSSPTNGWRYMSYNVRELPWSDEYARRAANCLIDEKRLVERVQQTATELGGPGEIMVQQQPGVIVEHSPYNNPNLEIECADLTWEKRVEEAKRLLAEGGWTWNTVATWLATNGQRVLRAGTGLTAPDGTPWKTQILYNVPAEYDPLRIEAGTAIAEAFNAFGFSTRHKPVSFGELVSRAWDGYAGPWKGNEGYWPGGPRCRNYSNPANAALPPQARAWMDDPSWVPDPDDPDAEPPQVTRCLGRSAQEYEEDHANGHDMVIIGWGLGDINYPDFLEVFFSAAQVTCNGCDNGFRYNQTGYDDPAYEALLVEFFGAQTVDELRDVVQRMEQHLETFGPYKTLFTARVVETHSHRVQYPYPEPSGGIQFWRGAPEAVKLAP